MVKPLLSENVFFEPLATINVKLRDKMKRIGCLWRNPVCEMGFIFWLGAGGGGGVFLESRSGVAPSASSYLYTISQQCL